MPEQYSTLSGWMIPISRAMEANGINVIDSLKACNISQKVLADQESRLAASCFEALITYCNQQKNRHDFSTIIAKHFHPGMFNVLGYTIISSNTLKDALERLAQYKRVVSNTCNLYTHETDAELIFQMEIFTYPETNRMVIGLHSLLTFLGTVISFLRSLMDDDFNANKICISYPKPDFNIGFLSDFFQCDIEFSAPFSGITLDRVKANKPLLGANPIITQTHEKLLNEFLCRIHKDDIIQQVRNNIYDVILLGTPSQSDIAKKLGMSLRNLQRKLNNQGSCFKDILDDTRKKLALDYIAQPHLSLGEVSYLVGFSNLSSFNRAFKRWTQHTPGEYRQQYKI